MKINYCNYARLNNHRFTQKLHMLFERFKITRWYMVLTRSHRFSCLKLRSNSLFWWKTATCKFLAFSPSSYFYLSSPDQIPHTICKMMTSVSDLPNLRSFETLYIAHILVFLAVFERQFSKLLLSSADGCESLQCKSVRDGVNQLISIHSLCERCPNCKQGKMSITTNSPTNKIVPSTDIYLS